VTTPARTLAPANLEVDLTPGMPNGRSFPIEPNMMSKP
jgi:hypothetical protein